MKYDSWKEGSAERNAERNTKIEDSPCSVGKKKDTKKWCKGKVNREHTLKCMLWADEITRERYPFSKKYRCLVCTTCGKELDKYYGFGKERRPDWAYLEDEKKP